MKQPLVMIVLIALLAACAPAGQPTTAPTAQLIEPTITATDSPATQTPEGAVLAADQVGTRPAAGATLEAGATDPIAAELAVMAQQRLSEDLGLPTRRIEVLEIVPVTWTDTSLGCPQPDTAYAPAQIDGYRVRLEAGDQEYVFHTDFDRLIACDPGREVLPGATLESTAPA